MAFVVALLAVSLNFQIENPTDGMKVVLLDQAGAVVKEITPEGAGSYTFEDVEEGSYAMRAMVGDRVLWSSDDVRVPSDGPVVIRLTPPAPSRTPPPVQVGAQRNENIVVNLVDNNAVSEQLGRQGVTVQPVLEFSAIRANYAAEFGGLGKNIDIIPSDSRNAWHGQLTEMLQNSVFNARTFFQVGKVQPSRRNQYGFNFGGPLLGEKLTLFITGEELRQSGMVNGNVLVPLADERTPRTNDPAVFALISRWLEPYPKELPNRTEIDPRMLNTNAAQKIRATGGTGRLDWTPVENRKISGRYAFQDTFIDSFEFVVGQNPNQRLRPQSVQLSWQEQASRQTVWRLGLNYLRRKAHLLVPPGAVGPFVPITRQIEDLGPRGPFPFLRATNEFEYLTHGTQSRAQHTLDWGAEVRRYQMNDLVSDESRGIFGFSPNLGLSAVENFLIGRPTQYRRSLGNTYRGWRSTEAGFFFNDRIRWTPAFTVNLGLRYELAGAPSEVNNLTQIPYTSDRNNIAPRIGLAYSRGNTVVRAGYGIAYGRVFPGTYQWSRFNPPAVFRVTIQNPDILNPLKDYRIEPGVTPRAALNSLDPNLVVPYSQQYTLHIQRELPGGFRLSTAYIGSRTWKLFQDIHENRGVRPAGLEVTTANVSERRENQNHFTITRIVNMGRAYFDAGQVALEAPAGRSLTLRAVYTWSKAIDTGSEFTNIGNGDDELRAQMAENVIQDLRAVSKFDIPHSFVVNYSYQLPWIAKGWTLAGNVLLRSGTPFTVESGTDSPPYGNVDGERQDRPDILDPRILGSSVDHPDTSQQILRRDAFDATAPFRNQRGNLGRNTFRKDGGTNFNMTLSRVFILGSDRSRTFTFRTEANNLMNHPQFDQPNFNWVSPSFGRITNTLNSGRTLQFVLQLAF